MTTPSWSRIRTLLASIGLCACGLGHGVPNANVDPVGRGGVKGPEACSEPVRLGPGLELVVLGSGGPLSAGRASTSYLVSVARTPRLLIDVGSGSFVRLGQTGLETDQIDTVLLTHLHIDHTGDLPGFIKSQNMRSDGALSLRFYGPAGRDPYPGVGEFLERLFGASGAFAYLPKFRNSLMLTPHELSSALDAAPEVLFAEEGLKVTSIAVDHGAAPTVAYRIDYGEHSVVVSGDLTSRHERITELARGADVLVYHAAVRDPPGSPPPLYELHTPPRKIGEVAAEAGVKQLILSHIGLATERHEDEVRDSVRAAFRGELRFARDCMRVPTAQ